MPSHQSIAALLIVSVLAACSERAIPTPTVIPTLTLSRTPAPTSTPTPTITPTPTPIGGTEPKVAFVGKDSLGSLGIYIDGLYTGNPEMILSVSEKIGRSLTMKWSPDGKRLVYWNEDEYKRRKFFVYDVAEGVSQAIANVPGNKDVFDFVWSMDGSTLYFGGATRSNPRVVYYQLDLPSGQVVEIPQSKERFGISANSHVNSGAYYYGDYRVAPKLISELESKTGGFGANRVVYDRICYYPELRSFGALKYDQQQATAFVLISPDGNVEKTVALLPAGFGANGFIDLKLSPDKSQILIIGEGGDGTGKKGGQFAYAAPLAKLPIDRSDPGTFDTWNGNHIHVFGWSPDSLNYLVAHSGNQFAIIQASSGELVYTYGIRNGVEPAFLVGQGLYGYDMVWPPSGTH